MKKPSNPDASRWNKAMFGCGLGGLLMFILYASGAKLALTEKIIAAIVVSFPMYYGFYKIFWKDSHSFGETLIYVLTPDILSALTGEYQADIWATVKYVAFWTACIVITIYYVQSLPSPA